MATTIFFAVMGVFSDLFGFGGYRIGGVERGSGGGELRQRRIPLCDDVADRGAEGDVAGRVFMDLIVKHCDRLSA